MKYLSIIISIFALAGCGSTPTTYEGSQYEYVAGTFSWTEAKSRAEEVGGYLAVLSSPEEYVSVTSQLPEGIVIWIGLTDTVKEGSWQWIDGTPLRADMVSNLGWGQRQDPERDYAHITLQRQLGSRANSGVLPLNTGGKNWVDGYLIEFD